MMGILVGEVSLQKPFDTVDHRYCWQNWVTKGFVEFKMIGLNPICLTIISMYP